MNVIISLFFLSSDHVQRAHLSSGLRQHPRFAQSLCRNLPNRSTRKPPQNTFPSPPQTKLSEPHVSHSHVCYESPHCLAADGQSRNTRDPGRDENRIRQRDPTNRPKKDNHDHWKAIDTSPRAFTARSVPPPFKTTCTTRPSFHHKEGNKINSPD